MEHQVLGEGSYSESSESGQKAGITLLTIGVSRSEVGRKPDLVVTANIARKAILATSDNERVVELVESGRPPRPILCLSVSLGMSRLSLGHTGRLEDAINSLSQLVRVKTKRHILSARYSHGCIGSVHVVALHETSRTVDAGPC